MCIGRAMIVLTLAALLTAGCGGSELDLLSAGGTVTYNGQPVPNATVSFVPEKGPMATAVTDAEGRFTLKTGSDDGVVAGRYKVTVYAVEGAETAGPEMPDPAEDPAAFSEAYEQMAENTEPPKWRVPEKYGSPESTPLTYEITQGGDNQFEIELTD